MNQDTQKLIGKSNLPKNTERDAIHVAVYPAIVGNERLYAGAHVRLLNGVAYKCRHDDSECVGIVDPFITTYDMVEGHRVFIFLNPGTVDGMRHNWTHPEIDKVVTDDHEKWLREFAARWNFDYEALIEEASAHTTDAWQCFITARGTDLHGSDELGEDHDLFWWHLEGLTKRQYDQEHRERFGWSCSC